MPHLSLQAGHDYLVQMLKGNQSLRKQVAAVALDGYRRQGPGIVVLIIDRLFEGWPYRLTQASGTIEFDTYTWTIELPNTQDGPMFYLPQKAIDQQDTFSQLIGQTMARCDLSCECVVVCFDPTHQKAALHAYPIPGSPRLVRGFGQPTRHLKFTFIQPSRHE